MNDRPLVPPLPHSDTCWDPARYLTFAQLRQRPSSELLERVSLCSPQRIYDIGCGPGLATQLLAERWPQAEIVGIDSSVQMLDEATTLGLKARWVRADLQDWQPEAPADLLFSSAVLHLVGNHETLFHHLLGMLRPGGCLAIHMPNWRDALWYRLIIETLESCGSDNIALGDETLRALVGNRYVHSLDFYYRLLKPYARELNIWETEQLQVVEGNNPIFDWVSVSALRPVLHGLNDSERGQFLAEYMRCVRELYPQENDGKTLFPFRRVFIVAQT